MGLRKPTFAMRLLHGSMPVSESKLPCCIPTKDWFGQKAFELKPRIDGRIYNVKVMIQISSDTKELLLIISTHLNH